jgi:hypothetical protein
MWRTYRLCRLLRCTPSELDGQPALLCEWFLQFDKLEMELQKEASERAG